VGDPPSLAKRELEGGLELSNSDMYHAIGHFSLTPALSRWEREPGGQS